jgi:hypothetical protein
MIDGLFRSEADPRDVLLSEPRRFVRVQLSGQMSWRSQGNMGKGVLCDISPTGASFEVPARDAFRIGPMVTLAMELMPGFEWLVADRACVVRLESPQPGTCKVGVEFPDRRPPAQR